jgi:hypothetical protein
VLWLLLMFLLSLLVATLAAAATVSSSGKACQQLRMCRVSALQQQRQRLTAMLLHLWRV